MNPIIAKEIDQKSKTIAFLNKEVNRFIDQCEKVNIDDPDLEKLMFAHIAGIFGSISAIYTDLENIFEVMTEDRVSESI